MRLFIATPVKIDAYKKIKDQFLPCIKGKWVDEKNLHLTHCFIGEDDPKKYKIDLSIPKEPINIVGAGTFGNKILFLKATSKHIDSIHKQIKTLLPNKSLKNFHPHITLCRIKSIKNREEFYKKVNDLQLFAKISFEVYLYSSVLTPQGPIYKKLFRY